MQTSTIANQGQGLRQSRPVEQLYGGMAVSDGAGVRLQRVLTQRLQRRLDPFLLLDVFASDDPDDYIAGFPEHPHRGFETMTYLVDGRMKHADSAGHEGLLERGGMQWMTAGRGVIHSETPQQVDGRMEGFQLWINLPAVQKMSAPWYRDVAEADIPRFATEDGVNVTVLAGTTHGINGVIEREATAPLILDLRMPAGSSFAQALTAELNAFVYVYRGSVTIGETAIAAGFLGVLGNQPTAEGVVVAAADEARLLLLAGRPLKEKIVQYGPFVMNSEQEIYQALNDVRDGALAP